MRISQYQISVELTDAGDVVFCQDNQMHGDVEIVISAYQITPIIEFLKKCLEQNQKSGESHE